MVYFLGYDISIWSLIISFIAIIFVFLKDFFIPAIFKPKLILEGINDEECVDNALSKTLVQGTIFEKLPKVGINTATNEPIYELKKESRWLRLRIKNNAGFFSQTAINCYVKLIEIRNNKNQAIRPFNAFPLMWVQYATPKNNLAKGEYHLLDLAYEYEQERIIYPASWKNSAYEFSLPTQLLERKEEKLGPDIYTFKLGIYGDNFDPIFKEIKVELTKKFGELRFAE